MPLGLGLGITKLKSLVSGLRVRFQGNATITAALDGILRELSADFVSNGTVTAALEAIKLLSVDFSGDGTLTGDLADYAYLLDDYSGAEAAYSIRLLSSTYTGALVRIRRSSDNAEKDFYPDSSFELSLSSEDGASTSLSSWIGSDSGYVVTWYDQSGSATVRNATQSTASRQPLIISAGTLNTCNGKACFDFATSRYLNIPNASTTATDLSFFFVRNIVTYPSTFKSAFNYKRTGITYNSAGGGSFGNGAHLYKDAATSKSDDYPQTTGQAVDFIYNIATLERNEVAATLAAGAGYGAGAGTIGGYQNTTQSFDNQIQELIVYESDETTNAGEIVTNINLFYSIF